MQVRRGDVIIVNLDSTKESQQRGTRPCLVVQNDAGNENTPTTIVVPFTTSFGDELYPSDVLVPTNRSPLKEDSIVLCSQLPTASTEHRIHENPGSIPDNRVDAVDTALEYSLGLRDV